MAEIRTADIVLSLTGRDRGQLMLVVAEEGIFFCWRTDVRSRAENPKRKRRKHVSCRAHATSAHGLSCKAKAG